MAEEIKFTEEELKKVKEIQQTYIDVQQNLGQVSVTKMRLEQQLESLDNNEEELKSKFIGKITEKYGDWTLNPETGTFMPNKSK